MASVSTVVSSNQLWLKSRVVEYTPEAYRQDDLNLFAQRFSPDLYGVSPVMAAIDGGMLAQYVGPGLTRSLTLHQVH